MDRRSFLSTSLGAVLTAGMPKSEPNEWSVYQMPNGDFIAARTKWDARNWYFAWACELFPLEQISTHSIDQFEGHCFRDDDQSRLKVPIVPWIREHIAADPQIPCYLFTDADF